MVKDLRREDLMALNAYIVRGLNFRQVYEETGVTRGRLQKLLERDDVKQIMKQQQQEFVERLERVVDIVADELVKLLQHPKAEVRLGAIDRWARITGRFRDNVNVNGTLTAEDIAKSLMSAMSEKGPVGEENDGQPQRAGETSD